jgi:hypothetical protein
LDIRYTLLFFALRLANLVRGWAICTVNDGGHLVRRKLLLLPTHGLRNPQEKQDDHKANTNDPHHSIDCCHSPLLYIQEVCRYQLSLGDGSQSTGEEVGWSINPDEGD